MTPRRKSDMVKEIHFQHGALKYTVPASAPSYKPGMNINKFVTGTIINTVTGSNF